MALVQQHNRIIIDPSALFRDEALGWLQNQELRPHLVVSAALRQRLADPQAQQEFGGFGETLTPGRRQELIGRLEGIQVFSWESVESPPGALAIRDNLRSSDDPLADVFADEWVFLVSQSWGILGAPKRTLDAFRRAGGTVYEVSRKQMAGALDAVRDVLPAPLLDGLKSVARPVPNWWIVVGGVTVPTILPPLGLPVAVLSVVLAGGAVIAGDP